MKAKDMKKRIEERNYINGFDLAKDINDFWGIRCEELIDSKNEFGISTFVIGVLVGLLIAGIIIKVSGIA